MTDERNEMEDIFANIVRERTRQDAQWGGAEHDLNHSVHDWVAYIVRQLGSLSRVSEKADDKHGDYPHHWIRRPLVKIAALAVAALQASYEADRREAEKAAPQPTAVIQEVGTFFRQDNTSHAWELDWAIVVRLARLFGEATTEAKTKLGLLDTTPQEFLDKFRAHCAVQIQIGKGFSAVSRDKGQFLLLIHGPWISGINGNNRFTFGWYGLDNSWQEIEAEIRILFYRDALPAEIY